MGRRRTSNQDSLDLLLDTICNTFGGVLFIAILVILLLQQTSPTESQGEPAQLTASESQQIVNDFQRLQEQLSLLRASTAAQDELLSQFSSPRLTELITQRKALDEDRNTLQAELDATDLEILEKLQRNAELTSELAQREQMVKEAKSALKTSQETLQQEIAGRTQASKTPVLKSTSFKQEVGFIMRYGRIYQWHKYDKIGIRKGLNTDDFMVVERAGHQLTTRPHPLRGIDLSNHDAAQARLVAILRQFNPQVHSITVVVRPDSFHAFALVRDTLIQQGFDYRLMPMSDSDPLADRGGSNSKVQ